MRILDYISSHKFSASVIIILTGIFLYQTFFIATPPPTMQPAESQPGKVIHLYYHTDCPHCHKAIRFLEKLRSGDPDLSIQMHNVESQDELMRFIKVGKVHNIPQDQLKVPLIIIGQHILIGYTSDATTGKEIQNLLKKASTPPPTISLERPKLVKSTVNLPIAGELNVLEVSLPVLAIVLGIVDGFNPCAMWVLIYMISLIVGLQDRTRIFMIIGSFLLASGILYFLFMTVWLNVFLLVGYVRTLTLLVGLSALYLGLHNIHKFILSGGQIVCEVGDISLRQTRKIKIKELITSPLALSTIMGIILLAFAVNSIEFICSSALPAVFTHVLSLSNLSPVTYYLYILLYVFFFMLDDLIIFVMAALAVQRFAGEKYAGLCHIIGGVLLVGIGTILSFFPEALKVGFF